MTSLLVAIPLLAAVLAPSIAHHDVRLRRVVTRIVVGLFLLALALLMPVRWLPSPELAALGLGHGVLGELDESTIASILRSRWLPSLGIDLSAALRPVDVFLLLAMAIALAASSLPRLVDRVATGRDRHSKQGDVAPSSLRAWDLSARLGLVAAATGTVLTSDAGVRAWCVALAWVMSALELGARSSGPRRSAWGGEGLVGGVAVLAVTCLGALQATAAGHARFSPPVAADVAMRASSPSEAVGLAMVSAAVLAAALLMGVFPLRRWATIEGEGIDAHGELVRDVAGWAMGLAVLRAGLEAAPGAAAAAVDTLLWITAGSLLLVTLAFAGCRDAHTRRRVFAGFASTITFGLMVLPSRASWSVIGLVVVTFTLAAFALVMGTGAEAGGSGTGSHDENDSRPTRTGTLAAWLAAGVLVVPFGPGLVAWMVLGRGLAAPPPVGLAPLVFDGAAVAATWIAAVLAIVACLTMLLAPPWSSSEHEDGAPTAPTAPTEGADSIRARVFVSTSVVRRRGLVGLALLVVCLPIAWTPLLAAADADAAWTFERWAHRHCQDEAAKVSGRASRSHLRQSAAGKSREDDPCGPPPSRATKTDAPSGAAPASNGAPFTSTTRGLDAMQRELAEEFGE
jgi:hypothetical protein